MLGDGIDAADAAAVPRRSVAVLLGAATSLAMAVAAPLFAPIGMATIPLWRMLLERSRADAPSERPAA